jgi:colanic acid/amylovoran biosynthesis glycosyltransferase
MDLIVVSPDSSLPASSFIRCHYEQLKNAEDYLYGGIPQTQSLKSGSLSRPRLIDRLKLKFSGQNYHQYYLDLYLKKNKVKRVLAEYGPTAVGILQLCKSNGIELIVHFHGFDVYEKSTLKIYRQEYAGIFDYAKKIIAVSKDMVHALVDMGALAEKIVYSPCGPDPLFYDLQPDFNSNTFISIGRFVEKKAPILLIDAFSKVLKKRNDAQLVMIGNGPLLGMSMSYVKYLNIADSVKFLSQVSHTEIPLYIKKSFCFLQHSIVATNGDAEGTPVSVMEASLAGLPVIATNHKGIPDVIINGITGYLVNEFDTDMMAEHMIYLLNDKETARTFGKTGMEFIQRHFSERQHLMTLNESIYG